MARSADCALAPVAVSKATSSKPIAATPPRSTSDQADIRRIRGSVLPAPSPNRCWHTRWGDRRPDPIGKRRWPPTPLTLSDERTVACMWPPLRPAPDCRGDPRRVVRYDIIPSPPALLNGAAAVVLHARYISRPCMHLRLYSPPVDPPSGSDG